MTRRTRLFIEALEDRRTPSFSPATSYAVAPNPQAVVTADFNNDEVLDLAVASESSSEVRVLLGNPDGTFQPALTSATGSVVPPHSLAVGDFNDDGLLDLATGNGRDDSYGPFDVSVLLGIDDGTNRGTGRFETSTSMPMSETPVSVAVGDFDGDGNLDLGVTGFYWVAGSAHVFLGNGAGGLSAPNTTPLGPEYHHSAAVADFNGDGIDDLATTNFDSGTVSVLLGNTSGYLQPPSGFNAGTDPYAVAAGDVNGDGHIDLVAAGGSVGVLLGDGSGGFSGPNNYATNSPSTSVVLGDFTRDGHLDVATTNTLSYEVSVLYGGGNGSFSTPIVTAFGQTPWAIAAGDFNGDTWLDVATAHYYGSNVSVLINDGIWPDPSAPRLRIGDVTVAEGNTGTVAAAFTVTLSAASDQPVTVAYATGDGSATAGSDYQTTSGTLIFAPGETSKTITVPVIGDRLPEPTETFVVNLSSPTNATIADGQGVGTIVDDEPRISISDVTKSEGRRNKTTLFTFTVTLSAAYDQAVTMSYRTVNGTATTSDNDYVAKSDTLTFTPGETNKTITIEVKGDSKKEANETFYLDLFGLSSNALFTKNRGLGTIVNDD
jgi:hypothetical protein